MDDECRITKKVYYTHTYVFTYGNGETRPDTHDVWDTAEEALKALNNSFGCRRGTGWGMSPCTIQEIETYKIIRTKDIELDQNKDKTTWSLKTAGK